MMRDCCFPDLSKRNTSDKELLELADVDMERMGRTIRQFKTINYLSIVEGDARTLQRLEPFDFVFSNHLLHHLDWHEIKAFLDSILPRTRIAFIMNDLKRSRWAYVGFTLFSALLTRGSYHFNDGRLSIRRAFLPEELHRFLQQNFPDRSIKVIETYPARLVLAYSTQESPLR